MNTWRGEELFPDSVGKENITPSVTTSRTRKITTGEGVKMQNGKYSVLNFLL